MDKFHWKIKIITPKSIKKYLYRLKKQNNTWYYRGESYRIRGLLYIQQITNGNIIFEENGLSVCNADFSQSYPQIELYDESDNSYIIFWNDLRSSGKADLVNIYAQSITISSEPQCTGGDINLDGIINVIDIVSLVNYILGSANFNDTQFCAADLNSDTIINVIDIVSLVNLILSL